MRKLLAYNDKTNTHASRIYNQDKSHKQTSTHIRDEKNLYTFLRTNKYYHKFCFPVINALPVILGIIVSYYF